MLFHTLEFLVLFLAVLPWAIWGGSRVRRITLLAASYLFYAWFSVPLIGLLVVSSVLDFGVGQRLVRTRSQAQRRSLLLLSVTVNLGLLFSFKYVNWLFGSVNSLSMFMNGTEPLPYVDIILPLGISFYTFQTLSYTIDVYRGKLQPTKSLLTFALYVAFFPQLVAGPIVRAARLLPQLEEGPRYQRHQFRHGIGCFLLGLTKKVVVADTLAQFANLVFAAPEQHGALAILLGVYAFAFQIYADFSGYTDMARGIAFILGYDVGTNFRFPYFAAGIREFWTRWHISLSTWLRDYLYIPLGGSRCSSWRRNLNVMTTMLLGGLWHGANWTFVVWGALHGVWIICEHGWVAFRGGASADGPPRAAGFTWIKVFLTFHLVCVTWIFFRCESLSDAWEMCRGLFSLRDSAATSFAPLCYIVPLVVVDWLAMKTNIRSYLTERRYAFWLVAWAAIALVLAFGTFEGDDFVYFQF